VCQAPGLLDQRQQREHGAEHERAALAGHQGQHQRRQQHGERQPFARDEKDRDRQ
jgi:hypothetical protein